MQFVRAFRHFPIIGPSLSRALLLALPLLLTQMSFSAEPPSGVAPITPPSGFGIEGDLFSNTPTNGIGDWMLSPDHPGTGGAVLDSTGAPLDSNKTFHFTDPYNGGDSVFGGGSKWTDDPNAWRWTTSKASAKTDINNVLLHLTGDTNGHVWTVVSGDRRSTGGDSYIDFEFLQNLLTRNTNGNVYLAGPHGGRTVNDILLSLAFGGGGEVANFYVWQWRTNASGGYNYVDVTAALPVDRVFAALNSNTVAVPYGAFGDTNYPAFAFAEAAVDLTMLLGNFDPCLSFGFKTIMVKTKASQSDSATIEDFLDPIHYNVKIGPSADAGPDQTRCIESPTTAFALQGTATAGINPLASSTWSVIDGFGDDRFSNLIGDHRASHQWDRHPSVDGGANRWLFGNGRCRAYGGAAARMFDRRPGYRVFGYNFAI